MTNDSFGTRRARRGPLPLPADEKRNHCVSVRLSSGELTLLDAKRGRAQRGEWLRMAALDNVAPTVPELNKAAWRELARTAADLNRLAKNCDTRHLGAHVDETCAALQDFRNRLVTAIASNESQA